MHVKKGDKVLVIAGKEKGKTATIIRTIPSENKVVLEGLNLVKKHKKANKQAGVTGAMVQVAMPLDASNVKLADAKVKAEKAAAPKKKVAKKVAKKAE